MKLVRFKTGTIDDLSTGLTVRTERGTKKLSLRKLAIAMNISPSYLSDLELGRRHWTPELFGLAKGLIENHVA